MNTLYISWALLALFHSLSQIITRKPDKLRWKWLDSPVILPPHGDTDHTAAWLTIAGYVWLWEGFTWVWLVYMLLGHFTIYNIGIHILWVKNPDRNILQCILPFEIYYKLKGEI